MKTTGLATVDTTIGKTPRKGNLALGNEDCQLSIESKVEGRMKKTQRTVLDDMDSIAYGAEAWFEENTGYSRRVTEKTLNIARTLGIPEDEIERWAASRLIRDTEKGKVIKSLLERLQESSPADRTDGRGI